MAANGGHRIITYRDGIREWRWTFYAPNNKKMADSAEGYKRRSDCKAAIGLLKRFFPSAIVETAEGDEDE